MDKDLTIAHMQGKYILKEVTQATGHHIHEDFPEVIDKIIQDFLRIFKINDNSC